MLYEIATLKIKLGSASHVMRGISSYLRSPEARGDLIGCWTTEIGELNQVLVLRCFVDASELFCERNRALHADDPFDAGDAIVSIAFDSYAPFPFLPSITPGKHGGVYEIRTYRLKHGGLPHTIAAWEAAMPSRSQLSPLSIAMYALDGVPRFTHIWPYTGLDARAAIRAESVERNIWPPKRGPAWLTGDMSSVIAIPTAISPLA